MSEFVRQPEGFWVVDVRSPGEFAHAHIPVAQSLPLFSDAERARVGTAYKQVSRKEAIKIGLDAFGPRMRPLVEAVEDLTQAMPEKPVLVHCWRGGMRSAAVAWLLDLYGFRVFTLAGGYKAFRSWVLAYVRQDFPLRVLGGYTGTGKTALLHALREKGEDILDLEALACHRGSAFGNLGMPAQPSPEMLENAIAWDLNRLLVNRPPDRVLRPIWMEDESQRIGQINQPHSFFRTYFQKELWELEVGFESRLDRIVAEYGHFPVEELIHGVSRIQKRLGGPEYRHVVEELRQGRIREAFSVLLQYYDRLYTKSTRSGNRRIVSLPMPEAGIAAMADFLLNQSNLSLLHEH